MWQFLVGLLTGIGGVVVKDYFVGNSAQQNNQSQLNSIREENDKLRTKNKEAERLVEDLQLEVSRLKKQRQTNEDTREDLKDDLDLERRKNIRLTNQVSELNAQIEEYKSALQSLEIEIKQIKKS